MAQDRLRRELIEGMRALKKVGAVDCTTMKEFEKDLIGPPPVYTPNNILAIRERCSVSQAVFAVFLNVTPSTIQKWEQGQKKPSNPANRLLQVVDHHGLDTLLPRRKLKSTYSS